MQKFPENKRNGYAVILLWIVALVMGIVIGANARIAKDSLGIHTNLEIAAQIRSAAGNVSALKH
jgi:hypothetical protein